MNWKTTVLGVLTIVVAVGTAAKQFLATGHVDNLEVLITSITAGWGLIKAMDAKK